MNRRQIRQQIAKSQGVSLTTMRHAEVVRDHGIPELVAAVWAGTVNVSAAALLAREEEDRQRHVLATIPPRKIRAHLLAAAGAPTRHCRTCTCADNIEEPAG